MYIYIGNYTYAITPVQVPTIGAKVPKDAHEHTYLYTNNTYINTCKYRHIQLHTQHAHTHTHTHVTNTYLSKYQQ